MYSGGVIEKSSSSSGSRNWEVDRPHWVWKKPTADCTAVGYIGQWPKGWTSNLEDKRTNNSYKYLDRKKQWQNLFISLD